jgi:hypothetical protein
MKPDITTERRSPAILMLQDIRYLTNAKVSFERAVAIGEAALGTDHPDVAIWRKNLGNVLHDRRRLQACHEIVP